MVRVAALLLMLGIASHAQAMRVFDLRSSWEDTVSNDLGGRIHIETFASVPEVQFYSGESGTVETPNFQLLLQSPREPGGEAGIYSRLPVDGTRGLYGDVPAGGFYEFVFAQPIFAFGFQLGDFERLGSDLSLQVGDDLVGMQPDTWLGIVADEPFTRARIIDVGSAPRVFELDNVESAPVPEVSTAAALLLASIALLCLKLYSLVSQASVQPLSHG